MRIMVVFSDRYRVKTIPGFSSETTLSFTPRERLGVTPSQSIPFNEALVYIQVFFVCIDVRDPVFFAKPVFPIVRNDMTGCHHCGPTVPHPRYKVRF